MHSVFIILSAANLYLMTFAFGRADLGTGRPIIVILLFGMTLLWAFEFAMGVRQTIADKKSKLPSEQDREEEFRERLTRRTGANRR